jgi:transcriptional regulator with XRE-family HTH domain
MDIGTRLRELREAKGFSQGEIEKRTGLLRCYLSRVECGHTVPSLETLEKWARALDLELYQLFFVGKGAREALKLSQAPPVSREERRLLELFKKRNRRDKQLILYLVRKMASRRGA